MNKPYKTNHGFKIRKEAVDVTETDRKLAPVTQRGETVGIEELKIGQVAANFLSQKTFNEFVGKWLAGELGKHIVTLNPEMIMAAETDSFFEEAINAADLRVPDGTGLVWARWYLRSDFWSLWPSLLAFPFILVERIPGVDAMLEIARQCAGINESVYLLGGTENQNKATAKKLSLKFPSLKIHSAKPHEYKNNGPDEIIQDIQTKKPAVIFVAYGAPKQAIWIQNQLRNLPSVKIAMGVGGAFAIIGEEKKRAPQFLRKLNAEWLWRLALEPTRLKRIYTATIKFPKLVHQQKINGTK